MAIDIRHSRSVALTGGGPSQDILVNSTNGLTPKAAMFVFNNCVTNNTEVAHSQLCVGFSNGSDHRSTLYSCEDSVGTTNCWSKQLNDQAVFSINANTGTLEGYATCAFITNGVRLTWSGFPSGAFLVDVIFFFGEDMSVAIGDWDNSTDSSKNIGFRPDIVIACGSTVASFTTSGTTSSTADAAFSLGYMSGSVQSCYGLYEITGFDLSSFNGNVATALSSVQIFTDPTNTYSAALTLTDTGFNIAGDVGYIGFLAVSFNGQARSSVIQFETPTATGANAITTPFNTLFVLEIQSGLTSYGLSTNSYSALGLGIFSRTDTAKSHSTSNRHSSLMGGTTESLSRQSLSACRLVDASGAVVLTASFTSFGALNYTKNFTAVDATARKGYALVVSEPVIIDFLHDERIPVEDSEVVCYG